MTSVNATHPAVRRWLRFKSDRGLVAPFKICNFQEFAFSMADDGLAKGTCCSYLSTAFNFELVRDAVFSHVRIEFRIKVMHKAVRAYAGGESAQAEALTLAGWFRGYEKMVAWLALSGLRPVALENLNPDARAVKVKGKVVGLEIQVLRDKVKQTWGRWIWYPCTCGSSSSVCFHSLGVPTFRIERDAMSSAVQSVSGSATLYSARRLHCCAVACLLEQHWGLKVSVEVAQRSRVVGRINDRLGWCPNSNSFLRYSKGFRTVKWGGFSLNLFLPVVKYYVTGMLE